MRIHGRWRYRTWDAGTSTRRGQAMVEMGMVAPLLFLLLFGLVDFGRLVYSYAAISNASREGARLVSLGPQATSDCTTMQRVESIGQAFTVTVDPRSINGNADANTVGSPVGPTDPTTLQQGVAYLYIYPAMAQGGTPLDRSPQCDKSISAQPRQSGPAQVMVVYRFVPLTPLVAQIVPNGITLKAISSIRTEY
ncbi:MAG: hypothetical protein NVSMB17_15940 [Candidatus Dormibacteria bacterium]